MSNTFINSSTPYYYSCVHFISTALDPIATMPATDDAQSFQHSLTQITDHLNHRFKSLNNTPSTPTRSELDSALQALPSEIPSRGLGTSETVDHLLGDITKGLLKGHAGSRFFGLVTGGVTPASQLADILGTSCTSLIPASSRLTGWLSILH